MELAGLSVSQAGEWHTDDWVTDIIDHVIYLVYRVHPPSKGRKILVACGPGNNGMRPTR